MVKWPAPRKIGDSAEIVELVPEMLVEEEADRVASFLENCEPLLMSPGLAGDALLAEGGGFVRIGEMTDGVWVWPLSWSDYVRAHHVAPPLTFLEHIRSLSYQPCGVDPNEVDRLIDLLYPPGGAGEEGEE